MKSGHLFLLLAAIGLILLATSGKGAAIIAILKGSGGTFQSNNGSVSPPAHPDMRDMDRAGSGSGGVMT